MAKQRTRRQRKGGVRQIANSKQRAAQTEKDGQALALRLTGASYDQIARALGFKNKSTAWHAVERGLAKTIQEPADQVRDLELARLDRWLRSIDGQIINGSLEALDRGLRIMARRATLLGLDAPAKVAPTTPAGDQPYSPQVLHNDTFFNDLAALFQQFGSLHANGTNGMDAADTN